MTESVIRVMKFGGTSMQNAEIILSNVDTIKNKLKDCKIAIVVSASGKTTEALISALDFASKGKMHLALDKILQIENHHKDIIINLGIVNHEHLWKLKFKHKFDILRQVIDTIYYTGEATDKVRAYVLSYGETLSSILMHEALLLLGLNTVEVSSAKLIKTADDDYLNASCVFSKTKKKCNQILKSIFVENKIPVITGFFGSNSKSEISLLGRGASDYIASIIGCALKVDEIEIWTDADGMMSGDPKIIKNAKSWPEIESHIASELAFAGAKVMHPRAIEVAFLNNIKIGVYNSFNKSYKGTIIKDKIESNLEGRVIGVTSSKDNTIISIRNPDMLNQPGFIANVTKIMTGNKIPVDAFCTSETNISFSIKNQDYIGSIEGIFKNAGDISILQNKAKIVVVGYFASNREYIASTIFKILNDAKIVAYIFTSSASFNNITFFVDNALVNSVLEIIHTEMISCFS